MVGALPMTIDAHFVEAAEATIVGRWCSEEGYGVSVDGDTIRIHPRPNAYAAPPINIQIDRDRATYSQYYAADNITVNCTLLVVDSSTATETCNSPTDSFYPRPGESAVLRRCDFMLEPEPNV